VPNAMKVFITINPNDIETDLENNIPDVVKIYANKIFYILDDCIKILIMNSYEDVLTKSFCAFKRNGIWDYIEVSISNIS